MSIQSSRTCGTGWTRQMQSVERPQDGNSSGPSTETDRSGEQAVSAVGAEPSGLGHPRLRGSTVRVVWPAVEGGQVCLAHRWATNRTRASGSMSKVQANSILTESLLLRFLTSAFVETGQKTTDLDCSPFLVLVEIALSYSIILSCSIRGRQNRRQTNYRECLSCKWSLQKSRWLGSARVRVQTTHLNKYVQKLRDTKKMQKCLAESLICYVHPRVLKHMADADQTLVEIRQKLWVNQVREIARKGLRGRTHCKRLWFRRNKWPQFPSSDVIATLFSTQR